MEKVEIIGGGFSGLWTAIQTLKRGYDVDLIETNYLGYGASSKAAGILSFQLPEKILNVSLRSMELYNSLGDNILHWYDSIWIPRDEQYKCALNISKYLKEKGIKAEIINGDEIDGFLLGSKGLLISQPTVDIGKAINELSRKIVDLGGRILSNYDHNKKYDIIIHTNGPWIENNIQLKGLIKYKCQAHSVEGKQINKIIEDDIMEFYYVPESSYRAIIGNGKRVLLNRPEDGFITDNSEVYNILNKLSKKYKEALNMYPINSWSAPCLTTCDGYPIVGKINDNNYVLSGLNGAGLTLSAGLSEILVKIIEDEIEQPNYLDPLRFKKGCKKIVEIFDNICMDI
ncbi:FAD-dependent oxidoreductase [Caldisphaera sp.]|uniref:FAD-dependent oxidoreductase n=1 Tax=Caldisphaera sp. TaxID=2060322 RepID=UPI0025C05717|nr:FAD-dependent oxidoreductase [Caldisphaera sp.]